MAKKQRIFLVGVLACLALAGCKTPKSFTPELAPQEIDSEEATQQRMVDEINAKGGVPKAWRNRKNMRKQFEDVGTRIEKAGAEICVGLKLQKNGCYYYFQLTRNQEINSLADGKNIYIFTGMMRFVESDDELAVVMAHELTHNLMQHIESQKNNSNIGMIIGTAADLIASSQGYPTGGGIADTGSNIATLAYSVDFEREADYVGLYILARAGYDIKKAPLLWRRMALDDPEGIYNGLTHPSNAERSLALQKAVYEIEYKRKHNIALLPDLKK